MLYKTIIVREKKFSNCRQSREIKKILHKRNAVFINEYYKYYFLLSLKRKGNHLTFNDIHNRISYLLKFIRKHGTVSDSTILRRYAFASLIEKTKAIIARLSPQKDINNKDISNVTQLTRSSRTK